MATRDSYFDNAKLLLIFLVVFGHFISPLKSEFSYLYSLYKFIFLFHMPAFILISGYFSKKINQPGYIKKIALKLLVPYLIFEVIYSVYYYFTEPEHVFTMNLFIPNWALWFLLSMFFWKLLIVPFSKLPYALPIAIILGIAIGFFPGQGSFLSIERTFVYFPFFLLGFKLKKEHFALLRTHQMRVMSTVLLIGIFAICSFIFKDSWNGWLLNSSTFSELGVSGTHAIIMRLFIYALMATATFSILSLIPSKKASFTSMGRQTLYIYLLHGFIIKTIPLFIDYDKSLQSIPEQMLVFTIGSIIVCLILASKPVQQLMKPLIELRLTKKVY